MADDVMETARKHQDEGWCPMCAELVRDLLAALEQSETESTRKGERLTLRQNDIHGLQSRVAMLERDLAAARERNDSLATASIAIQSEREVMRVERDEAQEKLDKTCLAIQVRDEEVTAITKLANDYQRDLAAARKQFNVMYDCGDKGCGVCMACLRLATGILVGERDEAREENELLTGAVKLMRDERDEAQKQYNELLASRSETLAKVAKERDAALAELQAIKDDNENWNGTYEATVKDLDAATSRAETLGRCVETARANELQAAEEKALANRLLSAEVEAHQITHRKLADATKRLQWSLCATHALQTRQFPCECILCVSDRLAKDAIDAVVRERRAATSRAEQAEARAAELEDALGESISLAAGVIRSANAHGDEWDSDAELDDLRATLASREGEVNG